MPATRTWVSGVGDDASSGSRTAPRRTFTGAISATVDGGEIDALDPGSFGAVTIRQSLTIDGSGTFASLLATGAHGITIDRAGINVTLRGLSINGAGTGLSGVRIVAANSVHIQDCVIFGFTGGVARGVEDIRTTGGMLFITNTTIRDNGETGVVISPASGTTAIQAFLDRVRLEGNRAGLSAEAGSRVTVSNAFISGNKTHGLMAKSSSARAELNIESCVVTGNGTGIEGQSGGVIRLSNVHVTNNTTGLAGGKFETHGNNRIAGNNGGNGIPPTPARIEPQ